jgi:glycosyltransferase involved in cell wall biosynthesis
MIKYAVFSHIPYSYDKGRYITMRLWHWDIKAHMRSLADFAKLSVVAPMSPPSIIRNPAVFLKQDFATLELHPLPLTPTIKDFLRLLPRFVYDINRYVSDSDIIQSNSTIFPPVGVIALVCALFKNKKRIFVIDSDKVKDLEIDTRFEKKTGKRLLLIAAKIFTSFILNFCVAASNLTIVVGGGLESRYSRCKRLFKTYASCIREPDILPDQELEKKLEKISKKDPLKVIFAASLRYKKGILTTIRSFEILREKGIPVTLTIFGEGPLKKRAQQIVKDELLNDYVSFANYVPYGSPFYRTLRQYDAVLIPSLSTEQPRLMFDAWANGVAVIASDTEAHCDLVSNGLNGRLFSKGNATELASAIEEISGDRKLLRKLIQNGHEVVKGYTNEKIYARRFNAVKLFWKHKL